jgi:hypothetical protein
VAVADSDSESFGNGDDDLDVTTTGVGEVERAVASAVGVSLLPHAVSAAVMAAAAISGTVFMVAPSSVLR